MFKFFSQSPDLVNQAYTGTTIAVFPETVTMATKKKAARQRATPARQKNGRPAKKAAAKKASLRKKAAKKSTNRKVAGKKGAKKAATKKNKLGVKNSLVNNINARKKKGTARPQSKSTISKDAYENMQQHWGEE